MNHQKTSSVFTRTDSAWIRLDSRDPRFSEDPRRILNGPSLRPLPSRWHFFVFPKFEVLGDTQFFSPLAVRYRLWNSELTTDHRWSSSWQVAMQLVNIRKMTAIPCGRRKTNTNHWFSIKIHLLYFRLIDSATILTFQAMIFTVGQPDIRLTSNKVGHTNLNTPEPVTTCQKSGCNLHSKHCFLSSRLIINGCC